MACIVIMLTRYDSVLYTQWIIDPATNTRMLEMTLTLYLVVIQFSKFKPELKAK